MTIEAYFAPGNNRCFIIAEVAQSHDGSLGQAHAFVDAVAQAGADAVKFQTHIAAAESTIREPFRVAFSKQDQTRYAYWKRMEFSFEQWAELAQHAEEKKLVFLSSPFSFAAVELLHKIGMPAWKIASGEITNTPMLEKIAVYRQPVLLSTGLANWQDIDIAVNLVKEHQAPLALFQTTSQYPTPPENIGLNILAKLKQRYDAPVGLSDHTGEIFSGLAAYSLGARMLEVHVTWSHAMFGPDATSSLTLEQLTELVRGIRFLERSFSHPVDKDVVAEKSTQMRRLFGKSIVAARDLVAGEILTETHIALKKPGGGMLPADWQQIIGARLLRNIAADEPLQFADLQLKE